MDHTKVPTDIPVPVDDGATAHLTGTFLPETRLPSTSGASVALASLPGLTIVFAYPRTSPPEETVPADWNAIPGARGCTAQTCAFRDAIEDLRNAGVERVYGLSTQSTAFQSEAKRRLGLTYDLLSDERLEFLKALGMPTFEYQGMTLCKRVTLAVRDGRVEHVWYPVFPTDRSADQVLAWLKSSPAA